MSSQRKNEFLRYIFYSIVGAIIFMIVFTLWTNPSTISSKYEKAKDSINSLTYNQEDDPNIVFVDETPLKIADPEPFAFDRFKEITYTIKYEEDEDSDFIVANFNDESGYLNNKCYRVVHRTAQKDKTLCEECSNKTSGEIYCSIYDLTKMEGKGVLLGSFYATGGNGRGVSSIGSDFNLY